MYIIDKLAYDLLIDSIDLSLPLPLPLHITQILNFFKKYISEFCLIYSVLLFFFYSVCLLSTPSRASGVTKKVAEWRLDQNEEENSQRRRRGSNSSDVITVPLGDDALLGVLEGSMNNGDNRNGESYSNGIKEGDKIEEYSAESSMNTELSLNKPASNHNNTLNEGIISDMKNDQIQEGESSSINTSVSTSTRTTAMRTLIVLFDNTYSWYQPKELK